MAERGPRSRQVLSPDLSMNAGLFVYGHDTAGTLDHHVQDIRSKRQAFESVHDATTERLADRTVTTVLYAGELDGRRQYYRFTHIAFDGAESPQVVVLQVAFPAAWNRCEPVLDAVVRSIHMTQ